MTTPPSRESAFTDPANEPVLLDIEEHGDALEDPEYRALLGLPPLP